ncbi:MAG: BsuPI-related putative proteinase inhibitor [Gammaproteobacteria bacterium]
MKLKNSMFNFIFFMSMCIPLSASASHYVPWEQGDYGIYKGSPFGNVIKSTVDQSFDSRKHFTQFAGFTDLWILPRDEKVYVYDSRNYQISLLTDFSAAVGFQSRVSLKPCNVGTTTIAAKGLTVRVPAGTFNDVVQLDLTPNCADAGVTSIWFAAGVGPIKWTESNIAGVVTFELTEGMIAGQSYPKETGVILKGRFPEPVVWINMMPGTFPDRNPPTSVDVSITITNQTIDTLRYDFPTSQRFDIVLRDVNGRVVKKWSDGQIFLQVTGTQTIPPGESYTTGGSLILADIGVPAIPEGRYTLAIMLTSIDPEDATSAPGAMAPTLLTPLQIKWAQ